MKRFLFPLLLLLMATPSAHSQEPDSVSHPLTLTGYGLYDFHYATDGIGGGALMLDWQVSPAFKLGIGAEYVSSNRIAAKLGDRLTPTVHRIDGGYIVSLAIDGEPSAIIEFL